MKLEVLVSTYRSRLLKNLRQVGQLKHLNHVIVDQNPLNETQYPTELNIIPLHNSVGLTKNRNVAIEYSHGELILISDDDVEYIDDFQTKIIDAFEKNPHAVAISFQVLKPNGEPFKNYKNEIFFHNKRSVISTSSVELVFRRDILNKYNIKFDEQFGVNAEFPCGEEAVLLGQLLDLGFDILAYPEAICIHPEESSGKDYNRKKLLLAKGAMIRKLFGVLGFFLLFAFVLKNFKKIIKSKAKVGELFRGFFSTSKNTSLNRE
jgi:GT2 family glycosyltransferase